MAETRTRLPLDGLAAAQSADLYLVYGLAAKDRAALEQALSLALHASAMDPENGYRWEAKGTALAALGETQGALDALNRAVAYSPGDAQAWQNLARVYARTGQTAQQQNAQAHADALATHETP